MGLEVIDKGGKRFVKPRFDRATALIELGKIKRLYADDKQAGQGMNLTINVGQSMVSEDNTVENIGHLSMQLEP